MSRSSKSNLIVRDDGVELLLRFTQSADIVKDDFGFLFCFARSVILVLIVSITAGWNLCHK